MEILIDGVLYASEANLRTQIVEDRARTNNEPPVSTGSSNLTNLLIFTSNLEQE
jgi:hypothetical protein